MNYIGIDFSLNSPGICVWNGNLHFISYIKSTTSKKELQFREDLKLIDNFSLIEQPDFKLNQDFSNNEMQKLLRYKRMSKDIIDIIKPYINEKSPIIGFEGSSYGSKVGTNNIIDMASAATVLKIEILKRLKPKEIITVAPSTIKKHAGKGNMNKQEVYDNFMLDIFNELSNHSLFIYLKDLSIAGKIPKPIDDLIDAYFLNHFLRLEYT